MLFLAPLIVNGDEQTPVQKGQLTESLRKNIKAEVGCFENHVVRLERHFRPSPVRVTSHLQGTVRHTAPVALNVDLSTPPDFQIQPFGKRIDDRNTDAVQSAGYFVCGIIEFSTGMQLR